MQIANKRTKNSTSVKASHVLVKLLAFNACRLQTFDTSDTTNDHQIDYYYLSLYFLLFVISNRMTAIKMRERDKGTAR